MQITNNTTLDQAVKIAGTHSCKGGLYLAVRGGSRRWVLRYVEDNPKTGKRDKVCEVPLGHFIPKDEKRLVEKDLPILTLKTAREKAAELRIKRKEGISPKQALKGFNTFKEDAEKFYDHIQATWKSDAYRRDWMASLKRHVFPVVGNKITSDITIADLVAAFEPIWGTMSKADVILDRVRLVIDHAIETDDGDRFKGNPATRVKKRLPQGVKPVETPHGSLPWQFVPALYTHLKGIDTPAAHGLRFLLLCCTPRAGEIVGATWAEIKGQFNDEFHVPAERMKNKKARIIPLSGPAMQLLTEIGHENAYLFPTKRAGKTLDATGGTRRQPTGGTFIPFAGHMQKDAMLALLQKVLVQIMPGSLERREHVVGKGAHRKTVVRVIDPVNKEPIDVHGLRATFSTWVSEHRETVYDIEAREIALDHAVGDQVMRAYDRADLLHQRRELAERWSGFITGRHALAQAA